MPKPCCAGSATTRTLGKNSELEVFPHYLGVIVREAYRCKAIIDQLLGFGRKSDGIAVDVDLNALLQEITGLLRHHPIYRQVKMATAFCQDLPHMLADPSGLRQVFMNLLINAHQAVVEQGHVELTTGRSNVPTGVRQGFATTVPASARMPSTRSGTPSSPRKK